MQDHIQFKALAGLRIHLGVCGSVAAFKALELCRMFQACDLACGATLTDSAHRFVTDLNFTALGCDPVCTGMFAPESDIYAHLYPGQAADAFVIAPATAATLAKLAHGMADDMLSCQCLAFSKPLILAPAMNTRMWENPATQQNLAILRDRGHIIVEPGSGSLACGDEGQGRLADLQSLFLYTLRSLAPQDLAGKRIMITLGPTREQWDAVRFWSNPSSGRMGAALAISAWLRGADVHAIKGPIGFELPFFLHSTRVKSAAEMHQACDELWPDMDMGCFTAAVADFAPEPFGKEKFKKKTSQQGLDIHFTPTQDILADMSSKRKPGQLLIGFAAETQDLVENASAKLKKKNLDMVVANPVNEQSSGFGFTTNRVTIIDRHERKEQWDLLPKTEVAWRIWDWATRLLS